VYIAIISMYAISPTTSPLWPPHFPNLHSPGFSRLYSLVIASPPVVEIVRRNKLAVVKDAAVLLLFKPQEGLRPTDSASTPTHEPVWRVSSPASFPLPRRLTIRSLRDLKISLKHIFHAYNRMRFFRAAVLCKNVF